ncbi:MAG TPA: hypothetical protein VJS43_09375 [Candidatus Acidoferrales bacterium]|nr:hypothetical protein [Candidatus Acidoferrales bacterium]
MNQNKTGIENILQPLEQFCAEYEAMRHLLSNPPVPEQWRKHMSERQQAPLIRKRNRHRFDAVRDGIQSQLPESALFDRLAEALNKLRFPSDVPSEGAK